MEAEVVINWNEEGGHSGDRSTGEVIEIINKRGSPVRSMFL